MKLGLKKKLRKIISITSISAFFACVFSACLTLGWYITDNKTQVGVDGNVHGSYFESGDGSYEDPFEIKYPIQLYYLAWLQEMGYFNQGAISEGNETTQIKQYSFYLSSDLDMSSYVLPPIGTEKYPFVGKFNGNGHKISKLTVDNSTSANTFTDDPYYTQSDYTYGYRIVGLFGVIGSLDGENASTVGGRNSDGSNYSTTYTYDTSALSVSNFYLEDAVIKTSEKSTLIGAVAGYVNGPITNVGVNTSTITIASSSTSALTDFTTNFSDYSIVGYCTPKYKSKLSIVDTDVYTPMITESTYVASSAGNSWGDSIDMKTLLNRIKKLESTGTYGTSHNSIPEYTKTESVLVGTDDTEIARATTSTSTQTWSYSNGDVYYKKTDDIGSYYFKHMDSNDGPKVYVGGYSDVEDSSSKTVTTIKLNTETETAYYVRVDNNNHYASINTTSGAYTAVSGTTSAIKWHYDSNSGSLSTVLTINGTPNIYYLNWNSDSGFSVSTNAGTSWEVNNNQFRAKDTSNNFKIYADYNGQRVYLNINNGHDGFEGGNNEGNATVWTIENFGVTNNGEIYTTINNTKYNITFDPTNNNSRKAIHINGSYSGRVWYRVSDKNNNTASINGTNALIIRQLATPDGSGYYYNWNYNGSWRCGQSNSSNIYLIEQGGSSTTTNPSFARTGVSDNKYTISSSLERSGTAGYIPLSVEGGNSLFNDNGNPEISKFAAANKNTGYIVGGYYDKYNGKGPGHDVDTTYRGDVRIAAYGISKIKGGYSNNKFQKIYTINENNAKQDITNSKNFAKFDSAKNNLGNSLNGSNYVYGIHFMDSAISMNHIISADQVTINKTTYTNYEMPEDSVDFTLKDKGYINFFAGEYQNDTNAFFSLNTIIRDEENPCKIESIEKISQIYECETDPSQPYIYLYESGSFSDGGNYSVSSNQFTKGTLTYKLIFDTMRIGKNSNISKGGNDIFYFEIPVNAGEFALGSVEGGCGGYLIYLDIAAASQTIHRKTTTEEFVTTTSTFEYPVGVQYVDDNTSAPIDDQNSIAISLGTGATDGSYTVSRNGDNISPDSIKGSTLVYQGDGITTTGLTFGGTSTVKLRRITDYDFNDVSGIYSKQITLIETIKSGSTITNNIMVSFYVNTQQPNNFDDYDYVCTFTYTYIGESPYFNYKYYYHDADKVFEPMFVNPSGKSLTITVTELASDYKVMTGANTADMTPADVTGGTKNTITFGEGEITKADTWLELSDYDNTPTNLHYTYSDVEDLEVDYEFIFALDFSTLKNVTKASDPAVLSGSYKFTFTVLEGDEDLEVHYKNAGSSTFVQGTGEGTAEITFINDSVSARISSFMPFNNVALDVNPTIINSDGWKNKR